jgi:hypothetical protein
LKRLGTIWLTGAIALSLAVAAATAESQWVSTSVTGRLIYTPDAEGDRILDFSDVGYKGRGTQLIPNVPNVTVLSPVAGDDTPNIQAAINALSTLPIGSDGFRGAVLLEAGHYDINTQLTIAASGVVLRGVGRDSSDTVLHGRGTSQRPLVNITGTGSQSLTGSKRNMIDKVVPAGATSFRVDSTAGLAVGNTVRVERPSTAEWIEDIGMDDLPDGDPAWVPNAMNVRYDRVITRIEGNRIFLDAPLANSFDVQYGGGTIQSYTWGGRIENVGVENLRAESDYAFDTDENHAWEFVTISNAQNVWVRQTTSQYFGDSAVVSNPTAKWVTVDNAINLDPKSIITGERRYTFDLSGQLELVTNSEANSGRHDFVNNSSRPAGPHVFHNSVSNNALNDSGPHQRWATGTLFDNITVNGNNINIRNRGSLGTSHGWTGANMVVWNSTADGFIVQSPPTAQNWLIGSSGTVENDTTFGPQPPGYVDSHGSPVTVGGSNSLYEAQQNDSADIREFHWNSENGNWTDATKWQPGVTPNVYRVSTRDYLIGDIDGFTHDGAGSVDAAYIDPAWQTAIQTESALPITKFDDLSGNENAAFTIQHQLDIGERVVHGYLAVALRQSASGEVDSDFIRLFDMDPNNRFNFSDLGWNAEISSADTFVGVLDLGSYLSKLQSGAVNVQLNDDTGIDWALYVPTIATPIADPHGPTVFLDGGGTATVTSVLPAVRSLQIGGNLGGELRIEGAGHLDINEGYTQLADGTLTLQLSSISPSGAILDITDSAELAGTLSIELAGAFMPIIGNEFRLIAAAGGVFEQFATVILPSLTSDLSWQLSYSPTEVLLQVGLAGDFNTDGSVDAADYVLWRASVGQTGWTLPADANSDGQVDDADYQAWRANLGQTAGGSGGSAGSLLRPLVPEPTTAVLLLFGCVQASMRRRSRARLDSI